MPDFQYDFATLSSDLGLPAATIEPAHTALRKQINSDVSQAGYFNTFKKALSDLITPTIATARAAQVPPLSNNETWDKLKKKFEESTHLETEITPLPEGPEKELKKKSKQAVDQEIETLKKTLVDEACKELDRKIREHVEVESAERCKAQRSRVRFDTQIRPSHPDDPSKGVITTKRGYDKDKNPIKSFFSWKQDTLASYSWENSTLTIKDIQGDTDRIARAMVEKLMTEIKEQVRNGKSPSEITFAADGDGGKALAKKVIELLTKDNEKFLRDHGVSKINAPSIEATFPKIRDQVRAFNNQGAKTHTISVSQP